MEEIEGECTFSQKGNDIYFERQNTVSTCTGMKANSLMDVIQVILANTIGDELPPGSPPTRMFTL